VTPAIPAPALIVLSRDDVRLHLTLEHCIPLMRDAAAALSRGDVRLLLRSVLPLGEDHKFGIMPGALAKEGFFGAKLVSVFPQNPVRGLQSHQGVVTLFDPEIGAPVCIAHGGEVTRVRTAAASAAATDVLSRRNAQRLAILGCGEQAGSHLDAIACIRPLTSVTVWGRHKDRAAAFAREAAARTGIRVAACDSVQETVADADIVCSVTAASDPILRAEWLLRGVHVNAVGASTPDAAEIDEALVAQCRLFVDHRESALRQGGEIQRAKAAGLVGDDCIVAELGEVILGRSAGRRSDDETTVYKSLGNVSQDLASVAWLYAKASEQGFGTSFAF
jgi:ornithine cyclodeaminase/alanine dehydrogenase-like protein (mu-crystallin family)